MTGLYGHEVLFNRYIVNMITKQRIPHEFCCHFFKCRAHPGLTVSTFNNNNLKNPIGTKINNHRLRYKKSNALRALTVISSYHISLASDNLGSFNQNLKKRFLSNPHT